MTEDVKQEAPKSLRDEFAMRAMDMAYANHKQSGKTTITPDMIARAAYQVADAMMEARKK